jgi:hypothetical protein
MYILSRDFFEFFIILWRFVRKLASSGKPLVCNFLAFRLFCFNSLSYICGKFVEKYDKYGFRI